MLRQLPVDRRDIYLSVTENDSDNRTTDRPHTSAPTYEKRRAINLGLNKREKPGVISPLLAPDVIFATDCYSPTNCSHVNALEPQDALISACSPSTSAGLPVLINQHYKTKLCPLYFSGKKCMKAHRCTYAHYEQELNPLPDLHKTRLCTNYLKGKCVFGSDKCRWAHGRRELRSTAEFYKVTLCRYWLRGDCYAGQNCRHAHGFHELRRGPTFPSPLSTINVIIEPDSPINNKYITNATLDALNEALSSPPNPPQRLLADDCSTAASDAGMTSGRQCSNCAFEPSSHNAHIQTCEYIASRMPSSPFDTDGKSEELKVYGYKKINPWQDNDDEILGSEIFVDHDLQNTVISSLENVLTDDS